MRLADEPSNAADVGAGQRLKLMEIPFHPHAADVRRESPAIAQAGNYLISAPRLEIAAPDVVLSSGILLHRGVFALSVVDLLLITDFINSRLNGTTPSYRDAMPRPKKPICKKCQAHRQGAGMVRAREHLHHAHLRSPPDEAGGQPDF
jgi:hypothetical protein